MNTVRIINPAAGQGKAMTKVSDDIPCYVSTAVGDAEKYVYEYCHEYPETHFVICGGDGTINEVVNGVIKSGAADKAVLSALPLGTGNDFLKYDKPTKDIVKCDVLKYGDRYYINVLNIGFDCTVVEKVAEFKKKPLISGSFAYICGVVDTLFSDYGDHMRIETESSDGTVEVFDGEYMLCVAANAQYYGGGFKTAPLADITDGLFDVTFVKKISRSRFMSLVGDYKVGKHIDPKTKDVVKKFQDVMFYRRCRKLHVSGMKYLCADGEIENSEDVVIEVVPAAINFIL